MVTAKAMATYLVLTQLLVPKNDSPRLVMSKNSQPRQPILMHSPMVECIFLLQWDNAICQALLDLWGA
jgi:hypothetical protein